jgi:hypothetical protein
MPSLVYLVNVYLPEEQKPALNGLFAQSFWNSSHRRYLTVR